MSSQFSKKLPAACRSNDESNCDFSDQHKVKCEVFDIESAVANKDEHKNLPIVKEIQRFWKMCRDCFRLILIIVICFTVVSILYLVEERNKELHKGH